MLGPHSHESATDLPNRCTLPNRHAAEETFGFCSGRSLTECYLPGFLDLFLKINVLDMSVGVYQRFTRPGVEREDICLIPDKRLAMAFPSMGGGMISMDT